MQNTQVSANHLVLKTPKSIDRWLRSGQLYALVDPYFELPEHFPKKRLETRDTDPSFFDLIAWDRVTYQPPWLCPINTESYSWISASLATERWGVFVASPLSLSDLARTLQRFVIAKGPDQNPYFLRFHDASVLKVLLQTWQPQEQQVFFAGIESFILPSLDATDFELIENPSGGMHLHSLPRPEECLLTLSRAQLKSCSDAIERDLAKAISWHLRNCHARSVQHLQQDILETRVAFAISRARNYQLGSLTDLAGYAALMFELAPNFDSHPSFRRILTSSEIAPDAKMKHLVGIITDRDWEEVQKLYDRNFWKKVDKA